jgi:hypothetical protein
MVYCSGARQTGNQLGALSNATDSQMNALLRIVDHVENMNAPETIPMKKFVNVGTLGLF